MKAPEKESISSINKERPLRQSPRYVPLEQTLPLGRRDNRQQRPFPPAHRSISLERTRQGACFFALQASSNLRMKRIMRHLTLSLTLETQGLDQTVEIPRTRVRV